eukprot:3191464-Alexandrium_andersonii.AAC.1
MSASLVGSEMCIRDRGLVSASPPADPTQCLPWELLARRCQHSTMLPVSYTHLTLPTICSV